MKLKEFDFSLDIKRHKRTEDIILVQNDRQTTKFNINLMDGNHAFLIGENAEISIVFQKSDDTYIEQECEFIGNKVSVILVDQVLTKSGKVIAEIIIRSDNQVLTTTSFDFHVRKNILNDNAIESTNEIGILNKLIDTVKELIQKVINSIPRIGDNGNWFIGDEDTGKPSRGPKGDKGDKGEQGPKGEKGDKGDRGIDGIGAVHSVNDQVGDVYLTGEDIRVNQNQQWSVSYALNSLDKRKLDKESDKGLSANDFTDDFKNKLKGIEEGAEKNKVISVAGKTGVVTLTKSDISLGNVQNYGIATESEAKNGATNLKYMTPIRVKNALDDRYNFSNDNQIVIGNGASCNGNNIINPVVIGHNASTEAQHTISIGSFAKCTGSNPYNSVAIGRLAESTLFNGIAIGTGANTAGAFAVAIGNNAKATHTDAVAIGADANAANSQEGVLGSSKRTNNWKVPGSFLVGGTKNFEIPHPKPEKKATHVIRHGAVESPTAGDTLYRYKIIAAKDNDLVTIDLPDYFIWLNRDVQIFVTSQGHFGNGYGILNRETEQLEIHCELEGAYNVLVIGTRNDDHQSVQDWYIKGVEREIGESWTGETYVFEIDEIMEVEEITEVK